MKQISQLTQKTYLSDNDVFVIDDINDNAKTKYVSAESIKNFCAPTSINLISITTSNNSILKTYSNGFKEQMGRIAISSTSAFGQIPTQIEDPKYASITPTWGSNGDDNDFGFGCKADANLLNYYVYSRYNRTGWPTGLYWYVCGY